MRSETEVKENLEWLKSQCINYKDGEADRIVRQLETLLWVLGHSREEAEAEALETWRDSRSARDDHPHDY